MHWLINIWKSCYLILRDKSTNAIKGQSIISEYSSKKIYVFPGWRKNCEKNSLYFSLLEVENCPKLHFFGKKKLSRLAFFEEKLSKFELFWVKIAKICKFRGKN